MKDIQSSSMFDRVGGFAVIDQLVEAFYTQMESLPEAKSIRDMHVPDLAPTKRVAMPGSSAWKLLCSKP